MVDYSYILVGHKPVREPDMMAWATWMEKHDRRVAKTVVAGDVEVSTVFLGLDHHFGHGEPSLFESMIFGGPHDLYIIRCSTWEQAEKQHESAIELANNGLAK